MIKNGLKMHIPFNFSRSFTIDVLLKYCKNIVDRGSVDVEKPLNEQKFEVTLICDPDKGGLVDGYVTACLKGIEE